MRQTLNEIYFGKTKDVCNDLRYAHDPKIDFTPHSLHMHP